MKKQYVYLFEEHCKASIVSSDIVCKADLGRQISGYKGAQRLGFSRYKDAMQPKNCPYCSKYEIYTLYRVIFPIRRYAVFPLKKLAFRRLNTYITFKSVLMTTF